MVVISDGFKERGPEGAARERELREIVLGHGMRLVGPNCMGVLNTDPDISLNATFSQTYPPKGNVAFLSQSGALGVAILEYAKNIREVIKHGAAILKGLDKLEKGGMSHDKGRAKFEVQHTETIA